MNPISSCRLLHRPFTYGMFTALFLLMGCGSGEVPVERNNVTVDQPDMDVADTGSDEATTSLRAIFSSVCQKAFDCCDESIAQTLSGSVDLESCQEGALTSFSTVTAASINDALGRSTIELDTSAVEACRDALSDLSCEEWLSTDPFVAHPDACAPLITPLLTENAACTSDFECITGRCIAQEQGRACAQIVSQSESCDPAAGVICDQDSTCDTFETHRCVERLPEGRACLAPEECESGRCERGASGTNVCVAPSPLCVASAE